MNHELLTAAELEDLIDQFATLAIDAHRDGAILEPTFKDLDDMTLYKLNARWRTIQRYLTDFELRRPYLSSAMDRNGRLPPELGQRRSIDNNIFSKALTSRANEIGRDGRRDPREPRPNEIGSPDWDRARAEYTRRLDELLAPLEERIENDRQRFLVEQKTEKMTAAAARSELVRNRPAPSPEPLLFGVSFRGAELLVAAWMRHLGILDAEVTREKADGGIDVTSATHLAQVKHYRGKVGVVEVREIFGVAAAHGKQALFFTSTGYTAEAIRFGVATATPLFVYNAEEATLTGATEPARRMV